MRTMRWMTRSSLPPLMLALVIVAAGLLYPAPAGAAVADSDTLDQSQTAASTFQCWIGGSTPSQWAQIVTASQYGFVDRVTVYIDNVSLSVLGNLRY